MKFVVVLVIVEFFLDFVVYFKVVFWGYSYVFVVKQVMNVLFQKKVVLCFVFVFFIVWMNMSCFQSWQSVFLCYGVFMLVQVGYEYVEGILVEMWVDQLWIVVLFLVFGYFDKLLLIYLVVYCILQCQVFGVFGVVCFE